MTRALQQWKVLPHGKLSEIDENILTVTGELHVPMELPRRMTVVRLNDSRLVVFSAIALDEERDGAARSLRPSRVPDRAQRQASPRRENMEGSLPGDAGRRPEGARAKIEKIVPVDTVAPNFEDPNVQFVAVPGTRGKEAALVARAPNGTTLVLNDLVGNIRNETGFGGWLLRMAGFAGKRAQIPRVVKMALIKDPTALRAQLLQWAEIESLKRILVSHGSPIEENPQQTLRELARSLEEGVTAGPWTDSRPDPVTLR